MKDKERIETLLTALEAALQIADEALEPNDGTWGNMGIRKDWQELVDYAKSMRKALQESEAGE